MRFAPFTHMAWAKAPPPGIEIDLSRSGWPSLPLADLGAEPSDLDPAEMEGYGPTRLREALAARYGVGPDEVLVSVSCTHALFLAGGCLIEPGDRVGVETPGYQAIRHLPTLFGAEPVPLPRRLEEGWRVDPERAEALFRSGARLLVLSDLNNPTGAALSRRDLLALGEAAERAGARLLVDEIYNEFLPRGERPAAHRLHPRAITVSGATKAFGFGGLRIGWMIAEPEFVRQAYALNDYVTVLVPSPSARLAMRLLANLPRIEAKRNATVEGGRAAFDAWRSSERRVTCTAPAGGIVAFPRLPEGIEEASFVESLASRGKVRVVPGGFFGLPGHVRVGFGAEPERVREGLRRFSEALDASGR
ncbi:MAG: pyridoxal phosphate-dependent aminotransferase [Planctomycetes bacterium]|nr:pyridoxal phosphate-dependent aminotransferase [Planctomycetota bacterium]